MKADPKIIDSILERALKSVIADVYTKLASDSYFHDEAERALENGIAAPMVEHRIKALFADRLGLSNVVAMRKRG